MKSTRIDKAGYAFADCKLAACVLAFYVRRPSHLFREFDAPLYFINFVLPAQTVVSPCWVCSWERRRPACLAFRKTRWRPGGRKQAGRLRSQGYARSSAAIALAVLRARSISSGL